ncbi:hypothetical protein BBJ29_001620 [Phytophthora kernoviae]|uniref:Pirin N-terminal domain-containing protein n=1 Tax=Phytophthora kernoviae TaxID=325452 RepID=A0A3F2RKU2_9STRA|nr:hypothetical protein BBJ29_001620 [Phytophthora kernoviae]RLN59432.1 hypothetical protein BBP00_00006500 [Phytophthora kernoviae]
MTDFKTRQIAKNVAAIEVTDGAGAHVQRSIGSARLYNLDPFLMLDEFNVGLPGGFPDHPHRGFETVTYVLPTSKGHMRHEDFMGNQGELRPGDLQWMTPGRGIMHAEMPKSSEPAHGLQLWINLPKDRKLIEPRYQEIQRESVPRVFNADQRARMEYTIPPTHNVFVYGVSGKGKCVDGDIEAHEAIVMETEGDGVLLTAAEKESLEVVVVTGEPLNEPVFQYGPFVMSSQEDIQMTLRDFDLRTNGFEDAHGWRSEIAPRRRRG